MNVEVGSSATDGCRVQHFGQSGAETETRNHPTLSHRSELMERMGMDEPHLTQNLTRDEMGLITRCQVQADSRFDEDMELVQAVSRPHYDVHGHLEVELRFDLGSLDEPHLLLDGSGPRDGHWGVEFMRQEQSELAFQGASEEDVSLMAGESDMKDIKLYLSRQSWPRVPCSQEDDHILFDADVQTEANVIPDVFDSKHRKPADDSGAQHEGQPLIVHVNQEDATTWIDLSERQHSQCNSDVLLETHVDCDKQGGQAIGMSKQEHVDVPLIQLDNVVQTHKQEVVDCTVELVCSKESRESNIASDQEGSEHLPINAEGLEVWNENATQRPNHLESGLKLCHSTTMNGMMESSVVMSQHLSEVRQSDLPNMSSGMLSQITGDSVGEALECKHGILMHLDKVSKLSGPSKLCLQVVCNEEERNGNTTRNRGITSPPHEKEVKCCVSGTLSKEFDQGTVAISEDGKVETTGISHSLPENTTMKLVSPAMNEFVCNLTGSEVQESFGYEELAATGLSKSSGRHFPLSNVNPQEFQVCDSKDGVREVGNPALSDGDSHAATEETVLWSKVTLLLDQDGLCLVPAVDTSLQNTTPMCTEKLHAAIEEISVEQGDGAKCIPSSESTDEVQVVSEELERPPLIGVCISSISASESKHAFFCNPSEYQPVEEPDKDHPASVVGLEDNTEGLPNNLCSGLMKLSTSSPSMQIPKDYTVEGSLVGLNSTTYSSGMLKDHALHKEQVEQNSCSGYATSLERKHATECDTHRCSEALCGLIDSKCRATSHWQLPGHVGGICNSATQVDTLSVQSTAQREVPIPSEVSSQCANIIMIDVMDCTRTSIHSSALMGATDTRLLEGENLHLHSLAVSCSPSAEQMDRYIHSSSGKQGTADSGKVHESTSAVTSAGMIGQESFSPDTVGGLVPLDSAVVNEMDQDKLGCIMAVQDSPKVSVEAFQGSSKVVADTAKALSPAVVATVSAMPLLAEDFSGAESHTEEYMKLQDEGSSEAKISAKVSPVSISTGCSEESHLLEAVHCKKLQQPFSVDFRSCSANNLDTSLDKSTTEILGTESDGKACDNEAFGEKIKASEDCDGFTSLSHNHTQVTGDSHSEDGSYPCSGFVNRKIASDLSEPSLQNGVEIDHRNKPELEEGEMKSDLAVNERSFIEIKQPVEDKDTLVIQGCNIKSNHNIGQGSMNCKIATSEIGLEEASHVLYSQDKHVSVGLSKATCDNKDATMLQSEDGKDASKENAEQHSGSNAMVNSGEPAALSNASDGSTGAAVDEMLSTSVSDCSFQFHLTGQIYSCPQQGGELLARSAAMMDAEQTLKIREQTVFDNTTMQVQRGVPVMYSDEEPKVQNVKASDFCTHFKSDLNNLALRGGETSQKQTRSEMTTDNVDSFTEAATYDIENTKILEGKEKGMSDLVPSKEVTAEVQGQQTVRALQEMVSERESAYATEAIDSLGLNFNKDIGSRVTGVCPSNVQMRQVQWKGEIAARSVGLSQKKMECLPKFPVCRREDAGNFSCPESIVCEMNAQEAIVSQHSGSRTFEAASGNRYSATVDAYLSNSGNQVVSTSVPLHAKVPIQTFEGVDKHLMSRMEARCYNDMDISSASDVTVSKNNLLEQRKISFSVSLSPTSTFSNPQTIHGASRKGQSLHLQPQVTLPDLNVTEVAQRPLSTQPFTDLQQVQLRAQILVYGSLIQGALPDEALMIAAFSNVNGGDSACKETQREATGGGRVSWEKSWDATAERIQGRSFFTVPREPVLSTSPCRPTTPPSLLNKLPDESGNVTNLLSNASTGKIISSVDAMVHPVPSIRFPETPVSKGHITKSRQIPSSGSGRLGNKIPAAFHSPLVCNLPSSSHVIPSPPLSDTLQISQTAKPHEIESQLLVPKAVFPTAQIAPFTPGSGHWASHPPFLGPTWLPQSHSAMSDSSASFPSLQSFGGREVSQVATSCWRSLTSSRVPFVSVIPSSTSFNASIVVPCLNVGNTTVESGLMQKNNSGASKQVTSESRSRKRKKSQMEASLPVDMMTGSLPLMESAPLLSSLTSTAAINPVLCLPSSEIVASSLGVSSTALGPSPNSLGTIAVTSHLPAPIIEASVATFPKSGDSAALLTVGSSVMLSSMSQHQVVSAGISVLSETAMRELEQAKLNAEEATSFAASTVQHSEFIWRQLQLQKTSGLVSEKGLNLASSAVALAAAASVAKAAAAAARVAYDAALQAKLMGEEAMDATKHSCRSGTVEDQSSQPQTLSGTVQDQHENSRNVPGTWEMPSNCKSIITTAREVARKRLEDASAARVRAQNLESVVRAAELAAMAVSHAGAVVAMGDPIPFTLDMLLDAGPDGLNRLGNMDSLTHSIQNDKVNLIESTVICQNKNADLVNGLECSKNNTKKGGEFREKCTQSSEVGKQILENRIIGQPELLRNGCESQEGKSRDVEMRKDGADAEVVEVTEATSQSFVPQNEETAVAEMEFGPSRRLKPLSASGNRLMKDSMVEVLSDEDGLRGVWFSAKVLSVENGKALVIYDELLADDGHSHLKEWIDLVNSSGEAPRVRLAHPLTRIQFEGTRKRRRVAMGNHVWCVGDRVDAWIRDGWWEGEILDICEEDDSKVKVHFPGEGDTAFIKSWNLRPSLVWKEDHWVVWAELKSEGHQTEEEASDSKSSTPFAKQLKVDETQNDTLIAAKEKLRKVNSEENQGSQVLNIPIVPSIGESQHKVSNKTRMEGRASTTGKGVQEGGFNESSKVVFGVPKLTKKRKFIEVSKHYNSNRATRPSPRGEARGKSDGVHIFTSETEVGSDSINRAEDWKSKTKPLPKHLQKHQRKDNEGGRSRTVLVRNDKVKHFPVFGMGPRKDISSQNTVRSSFPSGKNNGVKSENKIAPSYGHQSDVQRSNAHPIAAMPKETSSWKQPILSKSGSVSTGGEHMIKDRQPLSTIKEIEEDKIPAVPVTEVSEPRRSSRRIQPTSKLLEGLQSTPKLGKVHHSF